MHRFISRFSLHAAKLQLAGIGMLILVQRTPLVRLLPTLDALLKAPFSRILQVATGVLGYAGAAHAQTGATTFSTNPATPATANVGEEFSLAFSITGTPAPAASWQVRGTLPPGLSIEGLSDEVLNDNIGTVTGTPTTPGTYEFTVQAFKGLNNTDVTNSVQYEITINVVGETTTPLEQWKESVLSGRDAGNDADPDGDRLPNLLEYALGLDPVTPDGASLPTPVLEGDHASQRLRIFFNRLPERNDVSIVVESASSPAGPWSVIASSANGESFTGDATIEESDGGSNLRIVSIRDPQAVGAQDHRFLRIRVTPE